MPHHMMNQMSSNVGKMTRLRGMQAGEDMEEGMGMLSGPGGATSEKRGPSLGRGMGVGSTADRLMGNGPESAMQGMQMTGVPVVPAHANDVPGFPQDAYMESSMMAMDKMVEKPETAGLPAGWSGYMGGMMTLIRVLDEEPYSRYLALKQKQAAKTMANGSGVSAVEGRDGY